MRQPGFLDLDVHCQRLSGNGDPLRKLAALTNFEAFEPRSATTLKRSDGLVGRPLDLRGHLQGMAR